VSQSTRQEKRRYFPVLYCNGKIDITALDIIRRRYRSSNRACKFICPACSVNGNPDKNISRQRDKPPSARNGINKRGKKNKRTKNSKRNAVGIKHILINPKKKRNNGLLPYSPFFILHFSLFILIVAHVVNAFYRGHDFCYAHTEVFINDHDFAFCNQFMVYKNVYRFACKLVKLDDCAFTHS